MKRLSSYLIGLCLAGATTAVAEEISVQGRISDSVGRAGMAAVLLPAREGQSEPAIVIAGGANFPHAKPHAQTPEERGAKAYYSDAAIATLSKNGKPMQFRTIGQLPRPSAYAAYASTAQGFLLAGGCNEEGHSAKVTRTALHDMQLVSEALPNLPKSIAYPAFALVGNRFYVIGGQETETSTEALSSCYMLNLDNINAGWKELAPMPGGRMLAAAAVHDGLIYVMGGCSLHPDAKGQPERTYLSEVLCYDPCSNTWARVQADMPETLVGVATPLPVLNGKIYVIGGDPGNFYRSSLIGKAPARHPGQNKSIYTFAPASSTWQKVGELPEGIATFPAVQLPDALITVSGEILPGVRTPNVYLIRNN